MKVYIVPRFNAPDKGEGGIRRVVDAQRRWLPASGIIVTDNISEADLCAYHGGMWEIPPPGVPVVAHTHGLYWDEYYSWSRGHKSINKDVIRTLKQADAVTSPSEWVAYALKRDMWLDSHVLYHGIEPDEWPEPDYAAHDNYVLWNKTRVDPVCDPAPLDELVARAPHVKFVSTFGNPAPNLLVTGNEPYERAKQRIARAGVYLCTSRETFGIGTLEAMAAGVPVLGFDYGGQSEIVTHQKDGYLAKPGDDTDLAVGLDYCFRHREFLGRNAREKVLTVFTWEQWIKQYAELYRTLVFNARKQPKVSVIIPYYNLATYVKEAVDSAKSAIKKAGVKGEIIVVNDASPEPLPEDVACDPSIYVHKNATNKDLAETLNVGFDLARGEYVIALDADNRLLNLDLLIKALDADRSLDVAYGRMRVFSDTQPGWISGWPVTEAQLSLQLAHKNQIPSTALYRKRIFTWVGGYRTRCYTAEDADFWTRALAVGAKARRVTEEVTLDYRDMNTSRSHQRKDWLWNDWYQWANGPAKLITHEGPVFIHDKPEISIIIPVGPGHQKYLLDALDSVQAQSQSFWNWEVVVINDSDTRLKRLPPWARVVPSKSRGVSAARNRGLWLAKGEYVLFLDADDYLHPDALYHMWHYLKTSTCDKAFVYTDWFEAETGSSHEVDDFDPIDVLGRLPYPVTCLYNRHDLIKNNILWDETFATGWEDWDFAINAVSHGLCGLHLKAPLLHYRLNSGSLRATAKQHSDEIKLKIKHKYADYYEPGGKTMPGCGGCGGGAYPSIMNLHSGATAFDGIDIEKDTTLVQYNPPADWTGTRTFVGRVTANRYRFSAEAPNNVRRVFNQDVPGLVEIGFFSPLEGAVGSLLPLQAGVSSGGGPSA